MRRFARYLIGCLAICLLGTGCDDDSNKRSTVQAQIVEGCKHLNYGDSTALDLSQMEGTAPSIHARYDLTLAASPEAMTTLLDGEATVAEQVTQKFSGTIGFE